jgi:hypothetical protein
VKMVVNNNLVNAAKKKYEAQIEEALATLHIYFNNSVGIGEHPDLLTEVDKYVGMLESASGKLSVLNKYFMIEEDKSVLKG